MGPRELPEDVDSRAGRLSLGTGLAELQPQE